MTSTVAVATPSAAPSAHSAPHGAGGKSGAHRSAHAHAAQAQPKRTAAQADETGDTPSDFDRMMRQVSDEDSQADAGQTGEEKDGKSSGRQPASLDGDDSGAATAGVAGTQPRILTAPFRFPALPLSGTPAGAKTQKTAGDAPGVLVPADIAPVPTALLRPRFAAANAGGERPANMGAFPKVSSQSAGRMDAALHVSIRMPGNETALPAPSADFEKTAGPGSAPVNAEAGVQSGDPTPATANGESKATPPTNDPLSNTPASAAPLEAKASAATHLAAEVMSGAAPVNTVTSGASASAPAAAAPATETKATLPQTQPRAAAYAPSAGSAAQLQDQIPEQHTSQTLRSVSLEFTPDGARDVRLRLSERSGEVHVSLHSTDPSFTGRLHEGVHDLIGSLANAGYDAEAWAGGSGRQNHRQQQEAQTPPGSQTGGSGEDFSGLMPQPTQEIS